MAQEKKWRNGDILAYKTFNSVWVIIFRDYAPFEGHIRYHALAELDFPENGLHVSGTCFMADDEEHMRLASEDEQNELFERLKKHGYRWDAEKKSLITIEKTIENMKQKYIKDAIIWNGRAATNGAWVRISDINYIEGDEKKGGYYTPACPSGHGKFVINNAYPYEDWMEEFIGTNKDLIKEIERRDEKKSLITIEPNEEKLKVTNPNIVKNTIWLKVTSMLDVIEIFEKQQASWQECEKHLKNINDSIRDILENGLTNNLR